MRDLKNDKPFFKKLKKLLVLEDELPAGEELKELLENEGYNVSFVTSGKDAIENIYHVGGDFGIILADIKMAEGDTIDGIEAVCKIQADYPQIPVIFTTAYVDNPDYRRRVNEGKLKIVDWVDKPLIRKNEVKLIRLIEEEIKKQKEAKKEEVRSQIETKLNEDMSSKMIQALTEELNYMYGIEFLIEIVKEIKVIFPPDKIDADEIFPYLNFIAYENLKGELEEKYPDQFVAFLEGNKVGQNPDRTELIKLVYEEYKRTDIFITKISAKEKVIKLRRPKRIIH